MEPTQDADPDVAALLKEVDAETPLRGTFFLNDAREMLLATREIERAAAKHDTTLYVGFQDAARLDDEAGVYRSLASKIEVVAFGVGRPRHAIDGVEWVSVPRDRHALHNQWFLVLTGEGSLTFVGYETSPPSSFRRGPSHNSNRTWDGFTSDDERLVEHLVQRLEHVRALSRQTPGSRYLVATDDGGDPRYRAVRDAGIAAARQDGASVVLYDRTTESYLTNPYPSGPWSDETDALSPAWELSPNRLDAMGRGYLATQVRAASDAGVKATAHLAVDTGATALNDAVARYAPDVVFLPAHIAAPSLLDRVRGNTLTSLTSAIDAPVRLIDEAGQTRHAS